LNPLTLSATSNALSPNLIMTAGAVYDFYSYDHVTGARINKLSTEDGGGLMRFMSGFFNMSLNIEGTLKKHQAAKDLEEGTGAAQPDKSTFGQALYRERFIKPDVGDISYVLPWKLRMSLYLNADRSNPLTPTTTALMNTYAMVSLSKVWQVGLNTGYDLMAHDFIFPAIQVFRDMHCWQMSAQWVPSGPYKSFYFQVGLKAPQLRDLRYKTSGSMK
jgi:hypothetical protein